REILTLIQLAVLFHSIGDSARTLWTEFDLKFMIIGVLMLFLFGFFLLKEILTKYSRTIKKQIELHPDLGLCFLVYIPVLMCLWSNSFIIAESSSVQFLVASFALGLFIKKMRNLKSIDT